jgi:4-amino-4-deoxy-L-arabinose transferase-like glycosyltransferase
VEVIVRVEDRLEAWSPRRRAVMAWLLVLFALGLRAVAAWQLERSWYGQVLMPDEATYDTWARKLLAGEPHHIHSLSPLPGYVLAGVYWLAGPVTAAGRVLNVVLGASLCALVYAIGRDIAGNVVGFFSAFVTALYGPFVLFSGTLLKEPSGLVLFAALVLLFLREYRRPNVGRVLLMGAVAGLLVNVRQNGAVVAVVLAAVLLWRARSRRGGAVRVAALLLAGATVTCAPFSIANLRGTGRASPLPLGGFDLYLGNHLEAKRPYWSPVPFTTTGPDSQGIEFMLEAWRRTGGPMSLAEASDWWTGEVVRTARAQPGAFARRLGQKALAALSRHEEADNHDLEFARPFIGVLRLPLLTYGILAPFGIAGLVVAARRSRRATALLLAALAYGATMVLVFPNMRVRAPLLVVLIPFAVHGLWCTLRHASRLRRTAFVGLAALVAAIQAIPVANTPDRTAQHNLYAGALLGRNDGAGAEAQWTTSAVLGGVYSDTARIAMASYRIDQLADHATARALLAAVPDDSVSAALKHTITARLLKKEGRLEEAAAALERSIQINGGDVAPRRMLIEIYRKIAPERVVGAERELGYVLGAWGSLAPPHVSED